MWPWIVACALAGVDLAICVLNLAKQRSYLAIFMINLAKPPHYLAKPPHILAIHLIWSKLVAPTFGITEVSQIHRSE